MGIGRFLLGSAVLFVGWMITLSGAVTVVGLPVGLAVSAVGLDLMLGPRSKRPDRRSQEGR